MAPKTKARSNLARSNAARSGWPVLEGYKVKLWAISKIARSNATRSNYTSNNTFISVGGVPIGEGGVIGGPGILAKSVTINDSMNDVPTTAQLTFYKFVPVEGSDLIITLGSKNNLRREFGGTIVSSVHRYVGDRPVPLNMVYDAQLIDYSWGLNRKKVSGQFTNASVATIAAAILTGAPGYTLQVATDIGATILDAITYSEQTPADALHQLVKRVGGDWFCDYSKVIRLFYTYTADTPPAILNRAHKTFRDLQWTRDLSQVVTRVYGDVGGSEALDAVAVGATLIPVGTAAWYEVTGGTVLIGQQRVTYTGVVAGGGGSLVGPGAAPTGAPNVFINPGIGVDTGVHDYAVTFKTAQGESVPGPRITVPVGAILPPATTPTAGKALGGATGPDPGVHDYAVSYTISGGETVPGPRVAISTDIADPPTKGPTPDTVVPGPGPDPGVHDYAVTYIGTGGLGETTIGPIGGSVSVSGVLDPPTTSATPDPTTLPGTGPDPGTHAYAVAFVAMGAGGTAIGSTPIGPSSAVVTTGYFPTPSTALQARPQLPPPTYTDIPLGVYDYALTFLIGPRAAPVGETTIGPVTVIDNRGNPVQVPIAPPSTACSVNATTGGDLPWSGNYHWTITFVGSTGQTYDQTTVGPAATINLPFANYRMHLTNIPIGPVGTVSRGIYLSSDQSPTVSYAFIGNNTQTFLDIVSAADYNSMFSAFSSSGQVGPPTNTATVPKALTVPIANIQTTPDARVSATKLYRRVNGSGGAFQLVATFDPSISVYGLVVPIASTQIFISGTGPGPLSVGWYTYKITYLTAEGETDGSAQTNGVNITNPASQGTIDLYSLPVPDPNWGVTGKRLYRTTALPGATNASTVWKLVKAFDRNSLGVTQWNDNIPDTGLGAACATQNTTGDRLVIPGAGAPNSNTAAIRGVHLSNIAVSAQGPLVSRDLYRQSGGAGFRFLTRILDDTTTTYDDTFTNGQLGAAPPASNGTVGAVQTVHVASIPTSGNAGRKLYRRSAGAGLRLVATIADGTSSTFNDTVPNAALGAAPPATNTAALRQITLKDIPVGSSLVLTRKIYRTIANSPGTTLKLVAALPDNVATTFTDTVNDAGLGAAALTVGTAQAAQVQLSAIPVGAPLVIARKVYRSKVGATQLQLLTTINDNTTQLWLDVALDNTLGANVPTDDTSLLAQPAGNVLIGSPTLPCASVAGFLPTGGWVTAGSQNLRYTGISGTNLIGVPPSGPGSIGATLSYNTTIVQAAMLNGIPISGTGTIRYPILKGDPVDVFVQVDDLPGQAAVRIQLPGSDGIIEDEIQDRRLSATEGRARARARLNMLAALDTDGKVGIVTVTYTCRDINTRAGRTVTINVGPPINLRGDFLIQRVTASKFYVPNQPPTYQVEASSVKFSYEELLRFIRDAGE